VLHFPLLALETVINTRTHHLLFLFLLTPSHCSHLEHIGLQHVYAGLAGDTPGPWAPPTPDETPKADDHGDSVESSVRGLDGGQGPGLGWVKGQGVIEAFNSLAEGTEGVLLVRCDLFRSQGGLLPRNADVIIVLSESWSSDCLDVNACYRLRLLSTECPRPVIVLRVAVQGTIEEALVRGRGSLATLQGRKISALLDVGSTALTLWNAPDPRSLPHDAALSSPPSMPAPPSLPLHVTSSTTSKEADNSIVFLSGAPYLSEKNAQSSCASSSSSSSTSGTGPNSGPSSGPSSSPAPGSGAGTGSGIGSSCQALSSIKLSQKSSTDPSEGIAGQGDVPTATATATTPLSAADPPSSSSLSSSSSDPPIDAAAPNSEGSADLVSMECAIESEKGADVPMQIESIALETPLVSQECSAITLSQKMASPLSRPSDTISAISALIAAEEKTADSSIAIVPTLSIPVPIPVSVPVLAVVPEKVDQSAAREALAKRWRRAFLRALSEAERAFSSRTESCLELSFSVRQAPLAVAPSLTSLFGTAAGALPTLTAAPVVKRTYAPRKKSDLTADSTTTDGGEKPPGTSSSPFSVSKSKEDEDDSDGKALKNRKTERKKDKKKTLVLPIRDVVIPAAAVGAAPVAGSAASTSTSTIPRPLVPSSSSSVSAQPKEDETHTHAVVEKLHIADSSDTVCNFGPEETEDIMSCESCWSTDRLAETILSLSLRASQTLGPSSSSSGPKRLGVFSITGLALRMASTVNREWQLQAENAVEDEIGGLPRGAALTALAPRGAGGLHAGPFNGPGRPPNAHLAPPLPVPTGIIDMDVSGSSAAAMTSSELNSFPGSIRFNGRPKVKSEFGPGFSKARQDSESRLNRKALCEADRVRLRRAGVGVSDAEQLFWSLIEPFTDTPLDKAKENPKPRPPGSFGGNAAVPPFAQASSTQLFSVISFRESLRELKRKGVSVDSHVQVHPLQNAMRGDVQLVPTWGQKSAISASHTQFTIRYVIPRNSTSKSARKSRASQSVNPRGERDKEPVRKRVLDQPILTTNIRNVRARLEVGVSSRPSSLGGTVNPLFTRLPPIRTALKPRGKCSAEHDFHFHFSCFCLILRLAL
jgi:hypothetical protein